METNRNAAFNSMNAAFCVCYGLLQDFHNGAKCLIRFISGLGVDPVQVKSKIALAVFDRAKVVKRCAAHARHHRLVRIGRVERFAFELEILALHNAPAKGRGLVFAQAHFDNAAARHENRFVVVGLAHRNGDWRARRRRSWTGRLGRFGRRRCFGRFAGFGRPGRPGRSRRPGRPGWFSQRVGHNGRGLSAGNQCQRRGQQRKRQSAGKKSVHRFGRKGRSATSACSLESGAVFPLNTKETTFLCFLCV